MRTVTDKELAELLRSDEMVYLLDDTDEIAWGFLGDGKNRRRVVSKAKAGILSSTTLSSRTPTV